MHLMFDPVVKGCMAAVGGEGVSTSLCSGFYGAESVKLNPLDFINSN